MQHASIVNSEERIVIYFNYVDKIVSVNITTESQLSSK
jgi:hypothetical protein